MSKDFTEHTRNEIWRERVRKEEAAHVIVTEFNITPGQVAVYTEKPNAREARLTRAEEDALLAEAEADPRLRRLVDPLGVPRTRHGAPVTSAHEVGWDAEPLVRANPMFKHTVPTSEITRVGAAIAQTGGSFRSGK
jgi:hypothetical protein